MCLFFLKIDVTNNVKICSICLQSLHYTKVITPCMHYFHKSCLQKWIHLYPNCPLCRCHIKCYRLIMS